jgi:hypothetical protein
LLSLAEDVNRFAAGEVHLDVTMDGDGLVRVVEQEFCDGGIARRFAGHCSICEAIPEGHVVGRGAAVHNNVARIGSDIDVVGDEVTEAKGCRSDRASD